MGSYFKPWRRKVGVIALAMACLFMSAWVRSIIIRDTFFRMHNWREFCAISNNGQLLGSIIMWCPDPKMDKSHLGWQWNSENPIKMIDQRRPEEGSDINLHFGRFHFSHTGENSYSTSTVRCSTPYWSIVIPLTLLSAWLLLSKKPVAKPPETQE